LLEENSAKASLPSSKSHVNEKHQRRYRKSESMTGSWLESVQIFKT